MNLTKSSISSSLLFVTIWLSLANGHTQEHESDSSPIKFRLTETKSSEQDMSKVRFI